VVSLAFYAFRIAFNCFLWFPMGFLLRCIGSYCLLRVYSWFLSFPIGFYGFAISSSWLLWITMGFLLLSITSHCFQLLPTGVICFFLISIALIGFLLLCLSFYCFFWGYYCHKLDIQSNGKQLKAIANADEEIATDRKQYGTDRKQ